MTLLFHEVVVRLQEDQQWKKEPREYLLQVHTEKTVAVAVKQKRRM